MSHSPTLFYCWYGKYGHRIYVHESLPSAPYIHFPRCLGVCRSPAPFSLFSPLPGKYGAVQTGSYYNIIICFHFLFSCFLRFFRFHLADASSIIYKLCQNVIPFSFSALFVSLLQPCGFLNFCKIMKELRNRTDFAPLST